MLLLMMDECCFVPKGCERMEQVQTTVDGLRAIELTYRPLRDISSGRSISYLSRTVLNTPGLGTIMPETFRIAAEVSKKSSELFPLELTQLVRAIQTLGESDRVFNWISLDIPASIIQSYSMTALTEKTCQQFSVPASSICFVLPPQLLTEKNEAADENITRLRQLGFHLMLSGFGEGGAQLLRLSELSVDYVMLSPYVTQQIGKNERTDQAINSIINSINDLGYEPVADGVKNSAHAETLYRFGCNFCADPLSGGYQTLDELCE